jgi:hypothetical protein
LLKVLQLRANFSTTIANEKEDLLTPSDQDAKVGIFVLPLASLHSLGRGGMTESAVRKAGRKALMATRPMTRVGRAVEKGETQGFLKILVDADTKEILGASLMGIECDEVIHSILDVMYAKAPYTVILRSQN